MLMTFMKLQSREKYANYPSDPESFPYSERMNDAQQFTSNQDLEFLGFEIPDLNFDYSLHEINDTGCVFVNNFDCHTVSSYNTERDVDEPINEVVNLNMPRDVGASFDLPDTSCFYLSSYADLFANEEEFLSGLI